MLVYMKPSDMFAIPRICDFRFTADEKIYPRIFFISASNAPLNFSRGPLHLFGIQDWLMPEKCGGNVTVIVGQSEVQLSWPHCTAVTLPWHNKTKSDGNLGNQDAWMCFLRRKTEHFCTEYVRNFIHYKMPGP